MLINKTIHSENLTFKNITSQDATKRYLLWFKNKKVTKFLDQDKNFSILTLKDLRENIIYLNRSKNNFFLKLLDKHKKKIYW